MLVGELCTVSEDECVTSVVEYDDSHIAGPGCEEYWQTTCKNPVSLDINHHF